MRKFNFYVSLVVLILAVCGPGVIFKNAAELPLWIKFYLLVVDLSALWLSLVTLITAIRKTE